MQRHLDELIGRDLRQKMVFLTGARQVGKSHLSAQLARQLGGVVLNYDVPADRAILVGQRWARDAPLVVLDEIHKMRGWKAWLKGVADGRAVLANGQRQQILVTGSARMDTFRQSGESLAGRYLAWRLNPLSVREWCTHGPTDEAGLPPTPETALQRLMERGGFPEPTLTDAAADAQRWRQQYATDLVREDVLEFSRLRDVQAMRLFVAVLRQRVGSPLSLASIARDMAVSPATLTSYLDVLQALHIVFVVRPFANNIARAALKQPKVYFYDTGMVQADAGLVFENCVALHLLKHTQFSTDSSGVPHELHYIRTKDDAEIDFCVTEQSGPQPRITHLVECKLQDTAIHRALRRFATELSPQHPGLQAIQLLRHAAHNEDIGNLQLRQAAPWLAQLAA